MKIGIHHRQGSFSDKWIEYCTSKKIDFKIVNCYSTDIVKQLEDCNGLMWHWKHYDYKDVRFAKQLTFALEKAGKLVFPNANSSWHFDDKVGQKYLLEAIGAPLISSFVFYDKISALKWIQETNFPKVFKLRGGAGSLNVKLIPDKHTAKQIIKKAFNSGFPSVDNKGKIFDRWGKFIKNKNKSSFYSLLRSIGLYLFPNIDSNRKFFSREKGYVYFQNFVPNNSSDIRVIVIGGKAFGIRRFNRKGDFRASGSGLWSHDKNSIPTEAISLAFKTAKQLEMQSLAIDIIFLNNLPLIVEISYAFPLGDFVDKCPGVWDEHLIWHEGRYHPEYLMIEQFINNVGI